MVTNGINIAVIVTIGLAQRVLLSAEEQDLPNESNIPKLIQEVCDNPQKDKAIKTLAKIGQSAVPALLILLQNENKDIRRAATKGLAEIHPILEDAVFSLAEALTDNDEQVADSASKSLRIRASNGREVIALLEKWLFNKKSEVADKALLALARIGQKTNSTGSIIAKALSHKDQTIRRHAVEILGHLVPKAKIYVPDLIAIVKSDEGLMLNAVEAIESIGKDAVPDLIYSLSDDNKKVRVLSSFALARIGRNAKEAVPAVIKVINNGKDIDDEKLALVDMLGYIGIDSKDAISALEKLTVSENDLMRKTAKAVLERIKSEACYFLPRPTLSDH